MNELLKRLFSTYAPASVRTTLGRASDATLELVEQVVGILTKDESPNSLYSRADVVSLDVIKRLVDREFQQSCVALAKMAIALKGEDTVSHADIASRYADMMGQYSQEGAPAHGWLTSYSAIVKAGKGDLTDLEVVILSGQHDADLPDALMHYSTLYPVTNELINQLSVMAAARLGSLMLHHTFTK